MTPLLIIGDVQGCADELDELLAHAQYRRGAHQLVFVGDLINRGPRSRAVLERARDEAALVVVGNHEEALLAGRGGQTMDRVRAELGADLDAWRARIAAWPTFLRFGADLIVVHAGIAPGKTPETSTRVELTRIREVDGRPWFDSWRGPETVVFGHWATRGKVDEPLAKGLDTGCVYGGALTGLWWPSCQWVSVPARRTWFDPATHRPTW